MSEPVTEDVVVLEARHAELERAIEELTKDNQARRGEILLAGDSQTFSLVVAALFVFAVGFVIAAIFFPGTTHTLTICR